MSYHEDWQKQWRSPAPKREYDAIIVGGGGHGGRVGGGGAGDEALHEGLEAGADRLVVLGATRGLADALLVSFDVGHVRD